MKKSPDKVGKPDGIMGLSLDGSVAWRTAAK